MEKKESKEKKTLGVSRLDSLYFFETDNAGDSPLLQKVRDKWETLRRCKEYLELCEGVEFNKFGIIELRWMALNRKKHDEITKRVNQLGIKQLLNPKKSFFELQTDIAFDIIGSTPVEVIAPKNLPDSFEDKKSHEQRFLKDGKYLTVKIDVSQKNEDIVKQIKLYLDYYRELIDLPDKRHHVKLQYWLTYDLLQEGKTPTEIIKILWPDEYQQGNESDVFKLAAEYKKRSTEYRNRGVEDWNEKAYKETYIKNQGGNFKLYARVRDHKIKAEKKIEELTLRFKETS